MGALRTFFILFVGLFVAPSVWSLETKTSAADDPAVIYFREKVLRPVLGSRVQYVKMTARRDQTHLILRVTSGLHNSPLGIYDFYFSSAAAETLNTEPHVQSVRNGGRLSPQGTLVLPRQQLTPEQAVEWQDRVRTLFRADPFFHPQLNAPDPKFVPQLSVPQKQMLEQLMQFEKQGGNSLVIMPTGLGKTVLAGYYLKEVLKEEERYNVFYIIENKEVLKEAAPKIAVMLGLNPEKDIQKVYDGLAKGELMHGSKRIIAITRSSLHARLDEFKLYLKSPIRGRAFFVFDEAHHVGTEEGQFQDILSVVADHKRTPDRVLALTATAWHLESNLIQRYFGNRVASVFTDEIENADLRAGRNVGKIARHQLLRAMAKGYLSPIQLFRTIEEIKATDESGAEYSIYPRDLLRRLDIDLDALNPEELNEWVQETSESAKPLIKSIAQDIRNQFSRGPGNEITNYDRGIIYVPSIAQARIYAQMLKAQFQSHEKISFQAYHSKMPVKNRNEAMAWIKSQNSDHRFMLVVKTFDEGVDIPEINRLILTTPYGENPSIALRRLLQHIGRGTRTAFGKTNLRLTDYTGDVERYLFSDVNPDIVTRVVAKRDSIGERRPYQRDYRSSEDFTDPTRIKMRSMDFQERLAQVMKRTKISANVLDRPIWALDISTAYAEYAMTGLEITTIRELVSYSLLSFLDQPFIGPERLGIFEEALAKVGLHFGMSESEILEHDITQSHSHLPRLRTAQEFLNTKIRSFPWVWYGNYDVSHKQRPLSEFLQKVITYPDMPMPHLDRMHMSLNDDDTFYDSRRKAAKIANSLNPLMFFPGSPFQNARPKDFAEIAQQDHNYAFARKQMLSFLDTVVFDDKKVSDLLLLPIKEVVEMYRLYSTHTRFHHFMKTMQFFNLRVGLTLEQRDELFRYLQSHQPAPTNPVRQCIEFFY